MPKLELLELRSTLVTDAKLAEIRRRFPKLDILDDGPSHRIVAPGEGRGNHRLVYSPDSAHVSAPQGPAASSPEHSEWPISHSTPR